MMTTEAMQRAEINDAELVAESREGNRDAFRLIVERYQTLISSLAYCATGNVTRSEDLAQETFVSAWKQLAKLREPAKLRPWLCSIARFLIGKEFRRQGREPDHAAESLEALDEWVSPEPLPSDRVISDEEKAILWRSLERIPEIYREPLVLFYREHQSIEAVVQDLGLSEDAVKQRLSRGRKLLQEQFLAFVAGALKQTSPGKTFTLGVIAALPLLATTAKAATVGTALAQHDSVAAKTTSSGGILQAISNGLIVMVYWLNAAVLPLAGYIGYKMGGDSQNSERVRRSVATFWRIMGISMLLLFCLPLLFALFVDKVIHLSDAKGLPILVSFMNVYLPVFMFGVVPLSLVTWIWQRRRRTVPEGTTGGPDSRQSPKSITIWVALAMTLAITCLGFQCWVYGLGVRMHVLGKDMPTTRSLSTREVQAVIADSQVEKSGVKLFENVSGGRTLSGDLLENGKTTPFYAPADNSTLALLAEKGISYETHIANRDDPPYPSRACFEAQRLLTPFSCFIVVAGAVTLLRGRHNRQSGPQAISGPSNERRVDRGFAALAACGMLALAVAAGLTTDWRVRRIAGEQVARVIAQHPKARCEVFQYFDGSRKLWISDRRKPEFIAPANQSTLGLLTRQGITYETYVASYRAGTPGYLGRSQSAGVLWILALAAAAGGLLWWAARSRRGSASRIQIAGAV
ncbi:MAG: sigma-70 family RNA polymerase sigma factor [Verrucomicrobiota bacterium]|jgi:RNA polymerase sigma factor (sigma-70 family)